MNIELLEKAMDLEVENLGGIGAAIEACERMYSAKFRTPSMRLSEVEDWEEDVHSLKYQLAAFLYCGQFKISPPVNDFSDYGWGDEEDDSFAYECDAFDDRAMDWFESKYPDFKINGNTLVIELCNYKGEGEGIALYATNKHLNIFVSKNESFNQVN